MNAIKCRISKIDFYLSEHTIALLNKVKEQNRWIGENIPYPRVLPEILSRQTSAYGNTMNLYPGNSAISNKKQLTRYNPQKFKISSLDEYFTDSVDNKIFGKKYDFSKSFFQQFSELLKDCYLPPLTILMSENCNYVNGVGMSKNCYLCFSTISSEDCYYCYGIHNCKDCIDCTHCTTSQLCYDCTNTNNGYQNFSCFEVHNSQDMIACFDCKQCHDCIACEKLEHKSYCIFNKQYSKNEYEAKKAEIFSSNLIEKIIENFYSKTNFKNCNTIINSENCSGAYIKNSKNLYQCYNSYSSQDCEFCITAAKSTDCAFGYYFDQNLSFAGAAYQGYNSHFCYSVQQGSGNWYSFCLFNGCDNCFGCVGLKKDSYCILNKQYSKSEYEDLLPRIMKHMTKDEIWGEFLPTNSAPYSYDTCFIEEFYEPINPTWIDKIGFYRGEVPEEQKIESFDKIENINREKINDYVFKCESSGKPYKIIRQELEFLNKYSFPLPRNHWKKRILKRVSLRENIPALNLK